MPQKPAVLKQKICKGRRTKHVVMETIESGDRVAFITYGSRPRALCGIVISAGIKDGRGRPAFRVLTGGKPYFARPHAIRKLSIRKA